MTQLMQWLQKVPRYLHHLPFPLDSTPCESQTLSFISDQFHVPFTDAQVLPVNSERERERERDHSSIPWIVG